MNRGRGDKMNAVAPLKIARALLPAAVLAFSWNAARAQSPDPDNRTVALAQVLVKAAQARSSAPKPVIPDDPWERVSAPTGGAPESIGYYSAGCLRGAVQLALSGSGYEVMRPSRDRYFGHPSLIDFIRTLSQDVLGHRLHTLLIGDMGQPRGGPTMSGHASHQTGLDVDIWFLQLPEGAALSEKDRESLNAPQMINGDFDGLTKQWETSEMDILKLASEQPRVERIFVNPSIKQALCDAHQGENWLSKLRPEIGHGDHFHVRLKCFPEDARCKAQDPVPETDGCDQTLAHWFTPEMRAEVKYKREHPSPPTMPTLPPLCQQVLAE